MVPLHDMLSVEAFEAAAAARLSTVAHDYYRSGAWGERTVRENVEAWSRLWLRPRCMVDVSVRDASIDLLGVRVPSPLLVAPTALHRMAHDEGEVATARAAGACGLPRRRTRHGVAGPGADARKRHPDRGRISRACRS